MPVVDVLQVSLLAEPGIPEQALEPLIVAVGLLILYQQPDKIGVGELGVLGIIQSLLKPPGHTEEFQGVESGDGLLLGRIVFLLIKSKNTAL